MEAFKEMKPEKEISGRDLYGGGHMGGEMDGNMSSNMPGRLENHFSNGRTSFRPLFQIISRNSTGDL